MNQEIAAVQEFYTATADTREQEEGLASIPLAPVSIRQNVVGSSFLKQKTKTAEIRSFCSASLKTGKQIPSQY